MGSYASEPKVDKESLDEYNDRMNCSASSMQGWRVSQEVTKAIVLKNLIQMNYAITNEIIPGRS